MDPNAAITCDVIKYRSFHVAVCVASSNRHLVLLSVKSLTLWFVCVEFMYAISMTVLFLALLVILCVKNT